MEDVMLKQFVPRVIRTKMKSALGLKRLSEENRGLVAATTALQQQHRSMEQVLAAHSEKQVALADRVSRLEARLSQLQARIDIVDYGVAKLFMYVNDASYEAVAPVSRHYRLTQQDREDAETFAAGGCPASLKHRFGDIAPNVTTCVLRHLWGLKLPCTAIDVGASYGFESIFTAQFSRVYGHDTPVVAFEPGVSATLLGQNVLLNGVSRLVRVEQAAISNYSGPGLIFGEAAHSENNRIVNRWVEAEDHCALCQVDSLDAYVARNGITGSFLVKIDTQGGEPEVLDGMADLLARHPMVLVVEFSPATISNRVPARKFLERLGALGTLCDLGQGGSLAPLSDPPLRVVPERGFDDYRRTVESRHFAWSDVLVIPHSMPDHPALLATLTKQNAPIQPT
jgi:FkbM family methyltransferase